jgi:hypothetical protein
MRKLSTLLSCLLAICSACGSGQGTPLQEKTLIGASPETLCTCSEPPANTDVCASSSTPHSSEASPYGNTWECCLSRSDPSFCGSLAAVDPWENCSTICTIDNGPGNGVLCVYPFPNNGDANFVTNPSVFDSRNRCDLQKNMYYLPATYQSEGLCWPDWTCAACSGTQERYNLGSPPGSSTSREHCCNPDPTNYCHDFAGHSGTVLTGNDDNCGWPSDCSTVACNATTCPDGCCDANHVCQVPGTSQHACGGTLGAACSDCGTGTCTNRACVAPPTCNQQSCPNGCCSNVDGTCVSGGSNAECGNSGLTCDTCDGFDTVCVRGPPHNLLACRPRGG